MNEQQTIAIAQRFLGGIGDGTAPDEIAAAFSADVQFEVPGDVGALPWIGHKTGRAAVADYIRDLHRLLELTRFEVHDNVANESRAVILGQFASKVSATGKIMESDAGPHDLQR